MWKCNESLTASRVAACVSTCRRSSSARRDTASTPLDRHDLDVPLDSKLMRDQGSARNDSMTSAAKLQGPLVADMRSAWHRCDCTQSALGRGTSPSCAAGG